MEAGEVFDMNCQEFWNAMPELDREADHQHVRECAACAVRMARERELAAGLRAMATSYRRVAAPGRVEKQLRAAFRARMGVGQAWRVQGGWRLVFPWTAAAAAVVALAVFMVGGRQPSAPAPRAEMAVAASAADGQGEYDGFIALPNAGRLADTEDVNLVRVEVPRSAMMALGLEVSPERASELVEADVMIGPDGLARAVRFVDSDTL